MTFWDLVSKNSLDQKAYSLCYDKVYAILENATLCRVEILGYFKWYAERWVEQDEFLLDERDTFTREAFRHDTISGLIDDLAKVEGRIAAANQALRFLLTKSIEIGTPEE